MSPSDRKIRCAPKPEPAGHCEPESRSRAGMPLEEYLAALPPQRVRAFLDALARVVAKKLVAEIRAGGHPDLTKGDR